MRLIAPFGFYGSGNIGDESSLQGFGRLLAGRRGATHVWVASRDPLHTSRVESSFRYFSAVGRDLRSKWAKYRAEAAVVAGGTPIMDGLGEWPLTEVASVVAEASRQSKPFAFVGCGSETLHHEQSRRVVSEVLAPKVTYWTVRSVRDRDRLQGYGVPPERMTVAADMAWLLDPVSDTFGRCNLEQIGVKLEGLVVAVNINNEKLVRARQPHLPDIAADFLDRLIELRDARILFFCNEVRTDDTFDAAAARAVMDRMRRRERAVLVPAEYWTPQQMLSMIACCDLAVSTRYHFCLFAALQGVPFIALKRSDKVEDLCRDVDWGYGASLEELESARLSEMACAMEDRRDALAGYLRKRSGELRGHALTNSVALDAIQQALNG